MPHTTHLYQIRDSTQNECLLKRFLAILLAETLGSIYTLLGAIEQVSSFKYLGSIIFPIGQERINWTIILTPFDCATLSSIVLKIQPRYAHKNMVFQYLRSPNPSIWMQNMVVAVRGRASRRLIAWMNYLTKKYGKLLRHTTIVASDSTLPSSVVRPRSVQGRRWAVQKNASSQCVPRVISLCETTEYVATYDLKQHWMTRFSRFTRTTDIEQFVDQHLWRTRYRPPFMGCYHSRHIWSRFILKGDNRPTL